MYDLTKPIPGLLYSDYPQNYRDFLNEASELLDKSVAFGTHTITWCDEVLAKSPIGITPLLLLRHLLEQLDGVANLIRNGCPNATIPLIRSIYEAGMSLEYLCENDSENRSNAYKVSHFHNQLNFCYSFDPKKQQGKQYMSMLKKDRYLSDAKELFTPPPNLSDKIDNLEQLLKKPVYAAAEIEWQKKKKMKNGTIVWYSLFNGPNNINELAAHLKISGTYELFYRRASAYSHATTVLSQLIQSGNKKTAFPAIRYPSPINDVITDVINFSLLAIDHTIDSLVPEKTPVFSEWYTKHIQPLRMAIIDSQGK